MSSLLDVRTDVRMGAQEPVILHLPPAVHSLAAAEEAIELADAYGVCDGFPLAESQRTTLRAALGERQDGSWAATRVGDFGPRQGTGKNDKIAARELAGLILFGEQLIIHTAHEFPTANEAFLRLVSVFENWDDLRSRVARIRYANGEQGIELRSGQRLKYRARTGGSGRGFAKADLVVYDEAQHLSREHVAASGPAKLANSNSQTWYAGSGGLSTSAVAWALRRDAFFQRGGRLAYTEATAETLTNVGGRLRSERPDVTDVDGWYRSIPGLGRWVTEEAERALLEELGPELFGRECLCVWDPEPATDDGGVFAPGVWRGLHIPDAKQLDPVSFSIEIPLDRSKTFIGTAGPSSVEGRAQVEIAKVDPGTAWAVPWLVRNGARSVVLDGGNEAASLIPALEQAGISVHKVQGAERAQACGGFYDAVIQAGISHLDDPDINSALTSAVWKENEGSRVFSRRRSAGDISALYAALLALHGHTVLSPASIYEDRELTVL